MLEKITTVVLLAAGTGSRLRPLTDDLPKCLTVVGGQPILQRLLESFRAQGIKKIIMVTGYLEHRIRDYMYEHATDFEVKYSFNPDYQITNNIYSLWLARQKIYEPFILIESDLVYDIELLDELMFPDRIAVSPILPWMNGTTVSLDDNNRVSAFHMSGTPSEGEYFKTVNICSLSVEHWNKVLDRLDLYISIKNLGTYYEAVFADMAADGEVLFEAVIFKQDRWYEIDTLEDLLEADKLFNESVLG